MGWVALGVLALLLSGAPQAGDFGPPVVARIELVSVRVDPAPAWRGREVTGYLYLRPVVPDGPERPVESLATPRQAYLPGMGLVPGRFGVVADGAWHLPDATQTDRGGFWHAQVRQAAPWAFWEVPLYVYPRVRPATGIVGVAATLYLDGLGWVGERQLWVPLDGSRRVVGWDSAYGTVRVYLGFRG